MKSGVFLILVLILGISFSSCSTSRLRTARFTGASPYSEAGVTSGGPLHVSFDPNGEVNPNSGVCYEKAIFLLREGALAWQPAMAI